MSKYNIAICGLPGSGKTTVANYLVKEYGYYRCSTGDICRKVCRLLFDSEDRALMIEVTQAIKKIDSDVWVKAALRNARDDSPIVFDSMRFKRDKQILISKGFRIWEIVCDSSIRRKRIKRRKNKTAEWESDDTWLYELGDITPDVVIENNTNNFEDLYSTIDDILSK